MRPDSRPIVREREPPAKNPPDHPVICEPRTQGAVRRETHTIARDVVERDTRKNPEAGAPW